MRSLYRFLVLTIAVLASGMATAKPIASDDIPFSLRPWVKWVLADNPQFDCPYLYNNNADHHCAWSTPLQIDLADNGGTFHVDWQVFVGSWVTLPGDAQHWPQEVSIDGSAATVTERNGRPSVWLPAGISKMEGKFYWTAMPESLWLPMQIGIVRLSINGTAKPFPNINAEGRLWLTQGDAGTSADNDSLSIQVYRLITDEIPLTVNTRMELDVAGRSREVKLNGAVLKDFIALSLDSTLPARLEPDGTLRLQLRPGHWSINLGARHPDNMTSLALPQPSEPWPASELWAFEARNHLRMVDVQGVNQVDPNQTTLPREWRRFPAYRVSAGETMNFAVNRRGDPQPEPDRLSLNRDLWLDFDGHGLTFSDTIGGTMTSGWRLDLQAPMQLGRAAVDGQPQLITRAVNDKDSGSSGVEVRRGTLNLSADGRYEGKVRQLPAVGWDHDFQQMQATLHLPPGWKLFSVSGVDDKASTGAWLHSWGMRDVYLVGITAVIVYYLWDISSALLVLATLVLVWFEPGAQPWVWLNLVAAIALLRVLPEGRVRRLISLYRTLSIIALLIVVVPFMVNQVRVGLFPQLEQPWRSVMPSGELGGMVAATPTSVTAAAPATPPPAAEPQAGAAVEAEKDMAVEQAEPMASGADATINMERKLEGKLKADEARQVLRQSVAIDSTGNAYSSKNYQESDPKANVQTGPGLPRWQWTDVPLRWHGTVEKDQQLTLHLIPPRLHLLTNLLRVALLSLLTAAFVRISFANLGGIGSLLKGPVARTSAALLLLSLAGFSAPRSASAQEYPSPDLLNELRNRVTATPECMPQCAQSPRLRIEIQNDQLQLRMEVHASEHVAVPLPGISGHWLPSTVTVDGTDSDGLLRLNDGAVWLRLGPGAHQIIMSGALPARSAVQLPMPLTPRRVELGAHEGWRIDGVHDDATSDTQLMFTREGGDQSNSFDDAQAPTLPTFARIERTLLLGLEWRVQTRVVRLSAPDSAIVLEVPLIPGESITTDGLRVVNGKAQINMAAQESETYFESVLTKQNKITLTAPDTTGWVEVWRADVSPVLHASMEGIAVVHHQNTEGNWLPEWRPWPKESVTISIARPQGMDGSTFTIDASHLTYVPGERSTDVELGLDLRSSQGGQHIITLPAGATLQSVTLNGVAQPIRQQDRQVSLPLSPGASHFVLSWREAQGISNHFRSANVDLGASSVNASTQVSMPVDRWILLTHGPLLGPAVMFWGQLVVIALVAFALSRIPLAPLGFPQWLLLGIGLSQMSIQSAILVVGWLLVLGLRGKWPATLGKAAFNWGQIGIIALTVVALYSLVSTVLSRLEGLPEMQIGGNASSAQMLNWYQDHAAAVLPSVSIFSLPLTAYRLFMFAWSLWLAFAVVRWLRWGWAQFSRNGLWREFLLFKRRDLPPKGGVA
jgi:hypothetical protein